MAQLRQRYSKVKRSARSQLLDERVDSSGYPRKHASARLRGKRRWRENTQPIRRQRRRIYTDEDKWAALWLTELFDQIGSQRLRVAMDNDLNNLWRHKHLRVSRACYQRLQQISPATMDRMRAHERRPLSHTRGGTRPGTLLKSQLPIRAFADWNDRRPAFMDADLIQQDGGNASGFFAYTRTMTAVPPRASTSAAICGIVRPSRTRQSIHSRMPSASA